MSNKKFTGAPFGTQSARFDVSGVYPSKKKIGTFTEINHCKRLISDLERNLGPGQYEVDTGDFSPQVVQSRAMGPGWKRGQEMAQQAQMPHLLYRDTWLTNRFLRSRVGPGRYDIQDFTELCKKPYSVRGVCDSREERFKDFMKKQTTPGPGTYGKGGIPSGLLDERRRKPIGSCPMMDFSAGVERFPDLIVDSGLCPGTYNLPTFTEVLLSRHISKRGPYDLFTGRRDKPIPCGYFAAPKKANLNLATVAKPAKVLCEDVLRPEKRHHGKFGTLEQYPSLPTERIYLGSLPQYPRPAQRHSGHEFYEDVCLPKVENRNPPPFLSSSPRITLRAERLMQGNYTTVGVGRYNLAKKRTRKTLKKNVNAGYRYVFKSRMPRYLHDLHKDNFNQLNHKDQDSGLCPGTYNLPTFTEVLLSRHISKRGPYDLFTGD
ncbi:ciliary microtubule-associated protein 2-like [Oncorhynchus clarkii lewisi]|uniref:ciliary microtubule-associated protein 2-like n=1 Tax=Oncorhynchus clarkii lewisi TaxID=490388 RepID=UPI0039B82FB1